MAELAQTPARDRGQEALAEDEKRTSYLELFFDLVFVFAITQVTALILEDPSAAGFARSLLVLAMVWWAWSAYAWTTTAIDLSTRVGRIGLLAAMAGVFFMAIAVPDAYEDEGAWFAAAYFVVRALMVVLQVHGSRYDPELVRSSLALAPFFLVSPALVLAGGLADSDDVRTGLWAAALAVDVAGALNAGRFRFRVSASHFAERHALFVIIALGESIVAIGLGALEAGRSLALAGAILAAFAGTAALWWGYFDFVAAGVERSLGRTAPSAKARGRLARDVFTFGHFPMIAGVVLFAVAAKKAVAHGGDPLTTAGRIALAAGVGLFMLGFVFGRYRALHRVAWERLGAAAAVAALAVAGAELAATVLVALAVGILAVAYAVEAARLREFRAELRSR
jgi:low temperature requirement protein LtrA